MDICGMKPGFSAAVDSFCFLFVFFPVISDVSATE